MRIVAALLERGDIFEAYGNCRYVVIRIAGGYVEYKPTYDGTKRTHKMSVNSREKIRLVWDAGWECEPKEFKRKFRIFPEGFIT